jgi:hypothetical protein
MSTHPLPTVIRQQNKAPAMFFSINRVNTAKLSSDTLSILYPELDTIEVKVTIFPNAK